MGCIDRIHFENLFFIYLFSNYSRSGKMKGLVYILVNKTSFSLSTLRLTNSFIAEALENGGRYEL